MRDTASLVGGYLDAKLRVIEAGYEDDIAWAEDLEYIRPDAKYIVQEGAWVIVNSGFRNKVARKLWPRISEAFCNWDLDRIDESCVTEALKVLNHEGKIRAIYTLAELVRKEGIEQIVADACEPNKLKRLPFIGPVTCWHLAKILGADVIKPDVHLTRAAKWAGFNTALGLCEVIREETGERLTVVDSVLWRYGEQRGSRGWPDWAQLWAS